ncbi:MAG: hypothetical protein R3F56_19350 [Planctomycetota bacterium]
MSGAEVTVTVPQRGEWFVYVSDPATGAIVELGPVQVGADGTFEVDLPAGSEGSVLTVTDEREPIPTDEAFTIVSNS